MNRSKYIWVAIVIVALIFIAFLGYHGYKSRVKSFIEGTKTQENEQAAGASEENINDQSDNAGDNEADIDYNAICENGEWLKIADISGDLTSETGKLRRVYPDDTASAQFKDYLYYLEGTSSFGLTGNDLSRLDPFEGREVEIQGIKGNGDKEIAVAQVRCTGSETDKNLINSRMKLLNYIGANINSLAPHKAKYQKWTVDTVDFADNSNVYVEYYDTIEDTENSNINEDTSRKILLQVSLKSDGSYNPKVLAYWEMGEDNYVLKEGADKFSDVKDMVTYQYDPEQKTWERID